MNLLSRNRLNRNLAIVVGGASVAGFLTVPATLYLASHQYSIANLFESRAEAQTLGAGSNSQGSSGASAGGTSTTSPSVTSPSTASPSFGSPSITNPSFSSPSTTSPSLGSPASGSTFGNQDGMTTNQPSRTPLGNQTGQGQLPLQQSLPPLFPNQSQQPNPGEVPPGTQVGGQNSTQGTFQSPVGGVQQSPSNSANPGTSAAPGTGLNGGAAAPVGVPQSSGTSVVSPGYVSRPPNGTVAPGSRQSSLTDGQGQSGSTILQNNPSAPAHPTYSQSPSTQPYTSQTTIGEQQTSATGANSTSTQAVNPQNQTQYGQAVRALW